MFGLNDRLEIPTGNRNHVFEPLRNRYGFFRQFSLVKRVTHYQTVDGASYYTTKYKSVTQYYN